MTAAHIISVRNVNQALADGLHWLAVAGRVEDSRNGPVLVAPGPVLTAYLDPEERVLFSPLRDANPFFHLYECIWMLAGRNDAASVAKYAKTMESFADDEGILHGAYGFRWREYFGFDQLREVIDILRQDPKTRRAVLTMWAPNGDLIPEAGYGGMTSKDVPCNTTVYFDTITGALNMTVCNRSNDIVWGAYGANSVHMSFLQEVIAAALEVPVGIYYQFSNNYHTYVDRPDVARLIQKREGSEGYNVSYAADDRYLTGDVNPMPLNYGGFNYGAFIRECELLAEDPCSTDMEGATHLFLEHTFIPMMRSHGAYKIGDFETAKQYAFQVFSPDWRVAALEWLNRREAAALAKAAA